MARPVERVSRQVRRALIREAGGKCANPGCPTERTHIHHVAFKVYSTNDEEHLIAICPTCHDAVHTGPLRLDDDTLYRWKQLRGRAGRRGHVYVEPGDSPKLLLGTIAVTGTSGVIAFDLSARNRLSFSIEGSSGDIMLVDLVVSSAAGEEVVCVEKGHVRVRSDAVTFRQIFGHVRITTPLSDDFLPGWALQCLRRQEPSYGADGACVVLDLEVLEPGLVRVQGVWAQEERVVVITPSRLAFLWPGLEQPLSMCGEGKASILKYAGPITGALFGFSKPPPNAAGGSAAG
jgi:hypothetical protein